MSRYADRQTDTYKTDRQILTKSFKIDRKSERYTKTFKIFRQTVTYQNTYEQISKIRNLYKPEAL